jgi:glucan phosphorylase
MRCLDVRIRRIHEYKRAIAEHSRDHRALQRDPRAAHWVPRVKIFAGKAAVSYQHIAASPALCEVLKPLPRVSSRR